MEHQASGTALRWAAGAASPAEVSTAAASCWVRSAQRWRRGLPLWLCGLSAGFTGGFGAATTSATSNAVGGVLSNLVGAATGAAITAGVTGAGPSNRDVVAAGVGSLVGGLSGTFAAGVLGKYLGGVVGSFIGTTSGVTAAREVPP